MSYLPLFVILFGGWFAIVGVLKMMGIAPKEVEG